MIFDSTIFLFVFLPVSLLLYYITPGRFKNLMLAFLSLIFYAWGEPVHVILLLAVIVWNYMGGKLVAGARKQRTGGKKTAGIIIAADLLLLVVCKYTGHILEIAGHEMAENRFFLIPIGISFYMLQNISYIVDIYRGDARPQKSIVKYALFIAMFPKIVMGPLVSVSEFEVQLTKRRLSWGKFSEGILLFVRGMAKKTIMGRAAGEIFTAVQNFPAAQTTLLSAWIGCAAFALWMYFSVGGYCDMAAGLGKMFGFEFPENVKAPCMASGIMDFWSRWQSTVWKWFCSYVYLPVCGGNPGGGIGFLSLIVTWMLIGLWHGLHVTFLIWGVYFGILLYLEGFVLRPVLEKVPGVIKWFGTVVFVLVGWVFFFSPSIGEAFSYLKYMIGAGGIADAKAVSLLAGRAVFWIVSLLLSIPATYRLYERLTTGDRRWQAIVNSIVYGILFLLCVSAIASETAKAADTLFYFRF